MMDFPAYVPAEVRAYLTHYLEGGTDPAIPGYIDLLATAEKQLADIDKAIKVRTQRGEIEYLDSLRVQRADAAKFRDRFARDLDCLRRLSNDSRMRDAFALLTGEFSDDQQWRRFMHSAWSANLDFSEFRESRKRAAELAEEIAESATELAKLIRQFYAVRTIGPDEFYSVPELLRLTDNDDDKYMWRVMRRYVLGDAPSSDSTKTESEKGDGASKDATGIDVRFIEPGEKLVSDPEIKARDTLRYAWQRAPEFPALLDTVAKAARNFKPSESGFIGAAIKSQKPSLKTEYLRAFGNQLTDIHNFKLTTPIMKAMAIVANVVISLPDTDVTYDDVRKALAKLGG